MAMMLRHKPTGDIYIYTELLSRRNDMEVFEAPPPAVTTVPPSAKLTATVTPVQKVKPIGEQT